MNEGNIREENKGGKEKAWLAALENSDIFWLVVVGVVEW